MFASTPLLLNYNICICENNLPFNPIINFDERIDDLINI